MRCVSYFQSHAALSNSKQCRKWASEKDLWKETLVRGCSWTLFALLKWEEVLIWSKREDTQHRTLLGCCLLSLSSLLRLFTVSPSTLNRATPGIRPAFLWRSAVFFRIFPFKVSCILSAGYAWINSYSYFAMWLILLFDLGSLSDSFSSFTVSSIFEKFSHLYPRDVNVYVCVHIQKHFLLNKHFL